MKEISQFGRIEYDYRYFVSEAINQYSELILPLQYYIHSCHIWEDYGSKGIRIKGIFYPLLFGYKPVYHIFLQPISLVVLVK